MRDSFPRLNEFGPVGDGCGVEKSDPFTGSGMGVGE